MTKPRTLFDKIWDSHVVDRQSDGTCLLYIDRHLVHEVTSPQAFEGLRAAKRGVRRPDATTAIADHNVPTTDRSKGIEEPESRLQVETLERNVREYGIPYYGMTDIRQGIVHIIGPEQGMTQPGMPIVCGDSHTATHGAFGCLAFGIGTSEVEHVLATQTLIQKPAKNMLVRVEGDLPLGVTPKDLILAIIGKIGTAGGTGHVIEYAGSTIRGLSMEGRMTVCNMTIEGGARAGMVAPDETTFAYLNGREHAPRGRQWDEALAHWTALATDADAAFDLNVSIDAGRLEPYVTWGTNPGQSVPVTGSVPNPATETDERALAYMALEPGTKIEAIAIDRVFIGSCTNARLEDLRLAATVVRGHMVHPKVRAMVVPGSASVKQKAEAEGLDAVFREAGFEWRDAGCSLCLGMNPDILGPGERCASTSNRNFEGRQGSGGRTHLVSPPMAAAAAIAGHLVDVREFN